MLGALGFEKWPRWGCLQIENTMGTRVLCCISYALWKKSGWDANLHSGLCTTKSLNCPDLQITRWTIKFLICYCVVMIFVMTVHSALWETKVTIIFNSLHEIRPVSNDHNQAWNGGLQSIKFTPIGTRTWLIKTYQKLKVHFKIILTNFSPVKNEFDKSRFLLPPKQILINILPWIFNFRLKFFLPFLSRQ